MRRSLFSIAIAAAILFAAAGLFAPTLFAGQNDNDGVVVPQQQQNDKVGINVECIQSGRVVTSVPASTNVEIRGSGFNPSYPVWICVATDVCLPAQVDLMGSFSQNRLLQVPGTHTITITQGPNHGLESWVPRARMVINVTN